MEEIEKIKLSSTQATAYWWVRVIRTKIRELLEPTSSRNADEVKFIQVFIDYSETDWRNLYLELDKLIIEDINNYVPLRNVGMDYFSQCTAKGQHDRLNSELAKITSSNIADIRLASSSAKDSVIYTNMFGASVWYKSGGTPPLPNEYRPRYIITGDEKELDFYNLLLATLLVLRERGNSFSSMQIFKKGFCEEYKKLNPDEADVEEQFIHSLEIANERELASGGHWDNYLSISHNIADFRGLNSYIKNAQHYADVILQKKKEKK